MPLEVVEEDYTPVDADGERASKKTMAAVIEDADQATRIRKRWNSSSNNNQYQENPTNPIRRA
jgi:hypothetical protein